MLTLSHTLPLLKPFQKSAIAPQKTQQPLPLSPQTDTVTIRFGTGKSGEPAPEEPARNPDAPDSGPDGTGDKERTEGGQGDNGGGDGTGGRGA